MKWIDVELYKPNQNIEDLNSWTEKVIINIVTPAGISHTTIARMKGNKWYYIDPLKEISPGYKVTHWMKLPKPIRIIY